MASFRSMIGISPSTASVNDSVLVIIDAQNEYADGQLRIAKIEDSRKVISSLLDKYRAANAPVIHVVHEVPPGAPVFTPGTSLADELTELKPVGDEAVVTKNFPNSFNGTKLQHLLEATSRKKVVLTGYMAHICVSSTARQASENGWDVLVVEDGIGDRDIPGVDAATLKQTVLYELADGFGTVVHSKDIA